MLVLSRHVTITEVIENVNVKAKTKAQAMSKAEKRQCLECGGFVPDDAEYICGNCRSCYQANYRDIRNGVVTKAKLLKEGRQIDLPMGRPRKNAAAQKNATA